jgi:hypothetical protein
LTRHVQQVRFDDVDVRNDDIQRRKEDLADGVGFQVIADFEVQRS